LRACGYGYLWGTNKSLSTKDTGNTETMKLIDRLCVGTLFVIAIVDCLLVPRTYTGRIWIFGTGLALLFAAMLNMLRVRNGREVKGLKLFCITANVTMLVFAIALMASIGKSRTLQHPQIPLLAALLLVEAVFSVRANS